jgi:hypothetical protein
MMHLSCGGRVVADYLVRPDLALALSPRPYLHPIRTLAGVRVTDALPQDHPWHLGVSVGVQHVQDADGRTSNFWGGRTYQPENGYQWLDDHGRVEHVRWIARDPEAFRQELSWRVPGRSALLREHRRVATAPLQLPDGLARGSRAFTLQIGFDLENVTAGPMSLGSPGSLGREGGGYGGFFWRAAASETDLTVFTAHARGEDEVHGKPSEWLVLGGTEPATGRPWSLLLAGQDDATRADPWFVRIRDYPGVGSALAYQESLQLAPGARLSRSLLVVVVDDTLRPETAPAVLAAAREQ